MRDATGRGADFAVLRAGLQWAVLHARRMHRVQPLPVVGAYNGVPLIKIPADGHAEQV
jgi:hypothetical protein